MTVNGTGPFTEWSTIETYGSDLTETHVPGKPIIANSKSIYSSFIDDATDKNIDFLDKFTKFINSFVS